jgi:hypothetical protein
VVVLSGRPSTHDHAPAHCLLAGREGVSGRLCGFSGFDANSPLKNS